MCNMNIVIFWQASRHYHDTHDREKQSLLTYWYLYFPVSTQKFQITSSRLFVLFPSLRIGLDKLTQTVNRRYVPILHMPSQMPNKHHCQSKPSTIIHFHAIHVPLSNWVFPRSVKFLTKQCCDWFQWVVQPCRGHIGLWRNCPMLDYECNQSLTSFVFASNVASW
jgi:hypothetical protein